MNTPDSLPVDIAAERGWINEHKAATGASWTELARQTGVASGTLSAWAIDKYAGDNERIAREIYRYRQHLTTQRELDIEAPTIPGYVETPSSRRLQSMLTWAHRGRIVAAACAPGIGKTISMENYGMAVTNAFLITAKPSTAGVNNMLIATLAVLGDKGARGSSQALSDRIVDRVSGASALLMYDEAQHLSERSLDEIRSIHDATKVGVAFFGNETVLARIEGGSRKAAFAQLFSRISMRHHQNQSTRKDAEAIASAWGIENAGEVQFCVTKARMAGGLRGITMMLELATMIAAAEGERRSIRQMQEAWAQLVSRPMAE